MLLYALKRSSGAHVGDQDSSRVRLQSRSRTEPDDAGSALSAARSIHRDAPTLCRPLADSHRRAARVVSVEGSTLKPSFNQLKSATVHVKPRFHVKIKLFLVHGQVTIIFVVSVCLSVCLFVCLFVQSFSQPSSIRFGSN